MQLVFAVVWLITTRRLSVLKLSMFPVFAPTTLHPLSRNISIILFVKHHFCWHPCYIACSKDHLTLKLFWKYVIIYSAILSELSLKWLIFL